LSECPLGLTSEYDGDIFVRGTRGGSTLEKKRKNCNFEETQKGKKASEHIAEKNGFEMKKGEGVVRLSTRSSRGDNI